MINNIDKKILFSGLAIAIAFVILGRHLKMDDQPAIDSYSTHMRM